VFDHLLRHNHQAARVESSRNRFRRVYLASIGREIDKKRWILTGGGGVFGHQDIPGNERADLLAKEATKQTPNTRKTSLALIQIKLKEQQRQEWAKSIAEYTPKAIQNNSGSYPARFPLQTRKKLLLPKGTKRELASTFYQLKTGHGYNKSYLYRIGKTDSNLCSCGIKQTPEHLLLRCIWYNNSRAKLKRNLGNKTLNLPLLLHTKKGIKETLEFLKETKIATRQWYLGQVEEEEQDEEMNTQL
jgi:hypothetical protein